MTRVFVALGSNLGDRRAHLLQGVRDIEQIPECSDVLSSSIYETTPMGPQDQPDYLNSVCSFRCELEPLALLDKLKTIEKQHGRIESTLRWTARPLDLDILLYGDRTLKSDVLTIPHVGIADRSFVLWPLAELDETLSVPGLGPVRQLMDSCQHFGIKRYRHE